MTALRACARPASRAAACAPPPRPRPGRSRMCDERHRESFAQLLVHVVALHHAFPRLQVVIEYAEHAAARMDTKVATDLPAGVGEALPQEHGGRIDRAGGEHDPPC